MKSKGLTMVELIVSIGLISVVMVFVFNILVDVRQEEVNSSYRSQDVLNRSLIMRAVQSDFINRKLFSITECIGSQDDTIACLNFNFADNTTKKLEVNRKSIVYDQERWTLQTGSYDIDEDYKYCYNYVEHDNFYYMTIMFYVNLGGHVLENNVLLDIELFNTGLVSDVNLPKNTLTNATNLCDAYRNKAQDETDEAGVDDFLKTVNSLWKYQK